MHILVKRTCVRRLKVSLLVRGCMALQGSAPFQNDPYVSRLLSMVLRAIMIPDGRWREYA
jgi:hypothetical protein